MSHKSPFSVGDLAHCRGTAGGTQGRLAIRKRQSPFRAVGESPWESTTDGGRNLGEPTTRSRRDRSAPKFELEVDESGRRRQAQLAERGLGSTQYRERLPTSTLFEQHRCGVDVERVVVGVDLDGTLD